MPAVGDAVRMLAGLRGRALVLVYHRIVPEAPPPTTIVPSLPSDLFQRQVEALGGVGEIVPLEVLVADRRRHARPRFALTFDDDYATHVEHALPILRSLDAPATFFLSGRALRGLGPYWFELLEREIGSRGLAALAGDLGVSADRPADLALACEEDPSLQSTLEDRADEPVPHLERRDIETLAGPGIGVGFHTLRHRILPPLPDRELEFELTDGREDLESVLGRRVAFFAYPHGRADRRTAAKVRQAGYDAAFTGRPRSVGRGEDGFLLGRWEPGPAGIDDLLVGAAIRLTRGAPR
jgi:peptidoglycan/xylan/chitin deacetylase (PgdA/CDA1 family)